MNTVKELENLSGMIDDDKASILLVHGGLKPSALVVMQGDIFRLPGKVTHISPSTIKTLQQVLEELGLEHTTTTEVMENSSGKSYDHAQEVMRIFVAPNKQQAQELKEAFDDISNNHVKAGMLLGYPKTAVDAFLTADMLDWEDHPKSTDEVSELNMRLLGHRLSKANWREEVKYLEESGNYIQSMSPTIYAKITY